MPKEVGCIYWKTSAEPCTSILLPWYLGIAQTPKTYFKNVPVTQQLTLDYQFNSPEDTFTVDETFDWWTFKHLQDAVNVDYEKHIPRVRKTWDAMEADIFSRQKEIEQKQRESEITAAKAAKVSEK